MRKICAAATISLCVVIGGCSRPNGRANSAGLILGPVTSPLKRCVINGSPGEVRKRMVVGMMRIRLPQTLNFSTVSRSVSYEAGPQDPVGDDAETTDNLGIPNDPAFPTPLPSPVPAPPDPKRQTQPFHIYISSVSSTGPGKFLAVKVIKRKSSDYFFYDVGDIHGVGLGDVKYEGKLCANSVNIKGGKTDRQITTFFVDLSYSKPDLDDASFNIGVVPSNHLDTPIFIDPKVRNDG